MKTLLQKIWEQHEVVPETADTPAVLYIDLHLVHEVTSPQAFTVLRERGIEVRETTIPREMLYIADELFFTGTAAEVTPIRSVDRLTIGTGRRGPVTETLQKAFFGLFTGTTPDKWGWLDYVDMQAPARVAAG